MIMSLKENLPTIIMVANTSLDTLLATPYIRVVEHGAGPCSQGARKRLN